MSFICFTTKLTNLIEMKTYNYYQITIITITLLALISMAFKTIPVIKYFDDFNSEKSYEITYRYFFKTNDGKTRIRAFLPKNNTRQRISYEAFEGTKGITFEKKGENNNLKGVWVSHEENKHKNISYQFTFEGKSKTIDIPDNFKTHKPIYSDYLKSSEHIQVNAPEINFLAKDLVTEAKNDKQKIQAIFDYVYNIPATPIITLTDAVTVLQQNHASCNGKTRLFVALARNLGYPARIRGGIVLEETNKRTSHSWAEVMINGNWVPFDTLNNHFAHLPANYLELYIGDEFLIKRTAGIDFDYIYEIQRLKNIPFLKASADNFSKIFPLSLIGLIEKDIIASSSLILLLMLPIGGLLIAFLRTVIGLRTFGVFLPVLIAFSLLETGFVTGMLLFSFLILFVGIVSRPFNKLGLLHTPKLVISLSLMVLVMILGSYIGMKNNITWLTALTFFPTIILTISAERFSTLITEDGFEKATSTLLQTLLAVSVSYYMITSDWVLSIILLFPEIILFVIVLSMLLGRYVGLRFTELFRFKPLLNFKIT